jgi:hypothetical protein
MPEIPTVQQLRKIVPQMEVLPSIAYSTHTNSMTKDDLNIIKHN